MKKLKYLIIEDEPDSRDIMRGHMMQVKSAFECVGEATTGNKAIQLIQSKEPDLIFLDIELPDMTGFDILNAFRNPQFKVIFVTCFQDYAIDAFKYAAIDYLLKPFEPKRLFDALTRIEKSKTEGIESRLEVLKRSMDRQVFDRLILPLRKSYQVLMLCDIVCLEAKRGNYVLFDMKGGGQYLATHPMSYYEDLLDQTHFYRIHKSHMVNVNEIESVDSGNGGNVYMSNGEALPVAFRRKSGLMRILRERTTPMPA